MQIKPLVFAVSAALAAVSSTASAQTPAYPVMQPFPVAAPQAAVPGATPQNVDQWVSRMTDFTQNASAFKDPALFAAWTNAMTDPAMIAAMGNQMIEPGNMLRSMTTMMQPATTTNYMQFLTDPSIYLKWGGAMINPMWYTQMALNMADPGKLMRWMFLPMDPKLWQMGMQMMDPNLYMRWMMTPTDPRAMSLMFAPMNPQLYGSMAGGMVNPQLVGGPDSIWGTFMYPKQPVVQVQGPAPVASPINVWDPSTYLSMLNMFGGIPALPTLPSPGSPGMPAIGFPFGNATNPYIAPAPAAPRAAVPPAAVAAVPTAPVAAAAQPAAAEPAAAEPAAPASETLAVGGDTLFKTGKSSIKDLTPEGRARLDEVVAKIKASGTADSIKVTGHADKTGKPRSNQKLSLARAQSVLAYLKSKGVKAKRFSAVGMGDTKPVVDCDMNQPKNALKACLAPNRRVEIEVTSAD